MHRMRRQIALCLALVATMAGAYGAEPVQPPAHTAQTQAIAAFDARVKEYLALRSKLEATLPKLPDKATPQQIDQHQRALAALITTARKGDKPGEFFTPPVQQLVKRVMAQVLAGPDGKTIKASILDENPGVPRLVLNERYPTSIPLSTMPPQVLEPLPKLSKELEYHFIGSRLILLDTEPDVILDFTDEVFPK